MKKIDDIDEQVNYYEDMVPSEVQAKLPTFRSMFKAELATSAAKNSKDAIDLYQIGLKLKDSGMSILLEDAEFLMLKEACNANTAGYAAYYYAQLMLKLQEAEKQG